MGKKGTTTHFSLATSRVIQCICDCRTAGPSVRLILEEVRRLRKQSPGMSNMQQSKERVSSLHSGFELWSVYVTANFYVCMYFNAFAIAGLPVQVRDSFLKKAARRHRKQSPGMSNVQQSKECVSSLHSGFELWSVYATAIFMYVF